MLPAALFVIFSLVAVPAFAQGPYVGASVGMDVSRFTHVEAAGFNDLDTGGEVLNFSLRVGTAVGERWGVELGFTRPNELERQSRRGFPIPLLANALAPVGIDIGVAFPIFDSTRVERRNSTLETLAWVAQPVGDRVDLVYLGGLAFNRITEDIRFQFTRRIAGIVVPNSTRTVTYNVGPVAGLDARIGLTDHVQLVPGVRLQTLGGDGNQGWLVRTSAGLNWQF
ncbi:MAG: outer membrane beta-barrel protein [Vicinamibacterales bacterium]